MNLADGSVIGEADSKDQSPLLGQEVEVEAIVTASVNDRGSLGGFYIQEETEHIDKNPDTSEGILVSSPVKVSVGDLVRVEGMVQERGGETLIEASKVNVVSSGNSLPACVELVFPVQSVLKNIVGGYVANLESFEGMRVRIPKPMTVTEMFQMHRFNTVTVSAGGRLTQFTQDYLPDPRAYDLHMRNNAKRSLILDDGFNIQNARPVFLPGLDANQSIGDGHVFRIGDQYLEISGVLSYGEDFWDNLEQPGYRIHNPECKIAVANPRPERPVVEGRILVSAFNVLNFFTTLDRRGADSNPDAAVPLTFPKSYSTSEFERQRDKLVKTLSLLDADIVGLVELENLFPLSDDSENGDDVDETAVEVLVEKLNQLGQRKYDWVVPFENGVRLKKVGNDQIAVGLIYDTETLELAGQSNVLKEFRARKFVDPFGYGREKNRPSLAQTFREVSTGESFTVVVNHLKSKRIAKVLEPVDEDARDGQGYWNGTRTEAAKILMEWIASDPTASSDPDFIILGDLNAYANEDPVRMIESGVDGVEATADDFVNLVDEGSYSYVFDGQSGSLDHALASPEFAGQVAGQKIWNINADESELFNYNLDFGRDPTIYTADPFRSSDHDPIIIGLNLGR